MTDPIAVPIEDFLWCDACGEPHAADVDGETATVRLASSDTCVAYEETDVLRVVERLPAEWDRDYVAEYYDKRYRLVPKSAPALDCHRPMYYLATPPPHRGTVVQSGETARRETKET